MQNLYRKTLMKFIDTASAISVILSQPLIENTNTRRCDEESDI